MTSKATGASMRLELFVEDVPLTTEFFSESLGFQVLSSDQPGYTVTALDDVRIALADVNQLPAQHPLHSKPGERLGLGIEIVIEVEDVDSAYARARGSSASISSELQMRPWGARDFRVLSPGGYYIRVTSR